MTTSPSLRAISLTSKSVATCILILSAPASFSQSNQCSAVTGSTVTPVVELFTSEGCSSCPPADKWASSLKGGNAVVQAFHVGYWDHIGWVDRFAAPAHTNRQREIAAKNKLRSIYTPQAVLDGKDWPRWGGKPENTEIAKAAISLKQLGTDQFEASVTPLTALVSAGWSAYWTVTEHDHNSKVTSGENKGELLKHDFVVRQYTPAGDYRASDMQPQKLSFRSIASTPGHPRQVNLVVFDRLTGKTLQAISLQCTT